MNIADFTDNETSYRVGVASHVSQATVTPTANDDGATLTIDGANVASGVGRAVSLSEGRNEIIILVTAEDGSTTRTYTLDVDRGSSAPFGWKVTDDFNDLNLGGYLRGIWSDGNHMWVVCFDGPADAPTRLCSYNMSTKRRGPNFHTLVAHGNRHARDITSDGTTMWVSDDIDDRVYAYRLSYYSRDTTREINLANAGITSVTGVTVEPVFGGFFVADNLSRKLYAFNRYTLSRIPDADFNTLDAAGNDSPKGIWTDGTTMWVADQPDGKLYAYDRATKLRAPEQGLRHPQGRRQHRTLGNLV